MGRALAVMLAHHPFRLATEGGVSTAKPEERGQRTEVRTQEAEGGLLSSVLCPLSSVLCPLSSDFSTSTHRTPIKNKSPCLLPRKYPVREYPAMERTLAADAEV